MRQNFTTFLFFKFIFITLFYVIGIKAIAQTAPSPTNILEILKSHYIDQQNTPQVTTSGTEEMEFEDENAQWDQINKTWQERLYPHGDFSIASSAYHQYANKLLNQEYPTYQADWQFEGPFSNNFINAGRANRICLDPKFGQLENNVQNLTIYLSSDHGGLWKTINNGASWFNLGTDYFPQVNSADVTVSHQDNQKVYMASGMADEFIPLAIGQLLNGDNIAYTNGVFRSLDGGGNWDCINGNLMNYFQDGGCIHKITVNPDNDNQLFVASSRGILKTENANASPEEVVWVLVLNEGFDLVGNHDFRTVIFHPTNSNIVYAGGHGIWMSEDGGNQFACISGSNSGYENLNISPGQNFEFHSTNLAVTNANNATNFLYANLISRELIDASEYFVSYIMVFNGDSWKVLNRHFSSSAGTWEDPRRNAIAVHPTNPDIVYFGGTTITQTVDSDPNLIEIFDSNLQLIPASSYTVSGGCHADIHDIAVSPIIENGLAYIFAATDGGISRGITTNQTINTWNPIINGLNNMTCWACALSEQSPNFFGTANQDNGIMYHLENQVSSNWNADYGADGYNIRISDVHKRLFTMENSIEYSLDFNYMDNVTEGVKDYNSTYSLSENPSPIDPSNPNLKSKFAETFPIDEIPEQNKSFFGYSEVFQRKLSEPLPTTINSNPIDLWEAASDITDNHYSIPIYFDWLGYHLITEMTIAPSNREYVYLATKGTILNGATPVDPDPGYVQGQFIVCKHWSDLISDGTDATFISRTDQLPQYNANGESVPGLITGIAVSTDDPEHLWVSFTGFDPDLKVYESFDAGETWVNADPNGTLPNIPVNGIVFQNGSRDRLFIATDAGTWIKDEGSNSWQKYGNIPNVRTTELEINYCSNELFACTFGRGMWSTSLPPANGAPYVVHITEPNEIWSEDHYLVGSLQIDNGAKLTLNNGAKLFMPDHSFIAVDKGGTLVIDNATITNVCGELWNGIQVFGDETLAQTPAANQGYLIMRNNATIENAAIAVSLKKLDEFCNPIAGTGGGIIEASQAHFLNNVSDVEFAKYRFTNSLGNIASNRSHFYECEFKTNKPLNAGFHNKWHVRMEDVTLVRFKGCTFINDRIDGINDQEGIGISSFNSTFELNEYCTNTSVNTGSLCPDESMIHCRMENLNAGIIQKTLDDVTTFRVSHTDFVGNTYGIHAMNTRQLEISDCTFDVSPSAFIEGEDPTYPYGVHLEVCNGYKVEKNYFNSDDNSMERAGIVINNSNAFSFLTMNQVEQPNRIYYNDFTNLYAATIAQGDNQVAGHPTEGLEMLCGYYENNRYDISVTSWASQGRIAMKQGNDVIVPNNPSSHIYGAGNLFMSNDQNCSEPRALTVNPDCGVFVYYHKFGPNLMPDITCYTSELIIDQTILSAANPREAECVDFQNSESAQEHRNLYFQKIALIGELSGIITSIEDGGNAQLLLDVISNPNYNSLQVKNSILPICPNLSRKTLEALLERNPLLEPWHLCELLIVCSPIDKDLYEKVMISETFPQILKNILSQYQSGSSNQLRQLYSQMKQARIERDMAKYEFFRKQIFQSPNGEVILVELEALSNLNQSSLNDRLLISSAIQKGDWQNALSLLQSTSVDQSVDAWYDVFEILGNLIQENKSIHEISSEQIAELHSIANSSKNGSINAQIILELVDPFFEIDEHVVMPHTTRVQRKRNESRNSPEQELLLSCFPNPAQTETTLAFDATLIPTNKVYVQITTELGQILETIKVEKIAGMINLDITNFSSGTYTCNLIVDQIVAASIKLIKP